MAFQELINFKGTDDKIIVTHDEFVKRIRKSLYLADNKLQDEVSRPLADYVSELFSEAHKGHSLNRLNSVGAGNVRVSPCSLIIALIYLDRLNILDPTYMRKITPQELFIISVIISTKFYAGLDEEVYLSDWIEDGNFTGSKLKQLEIEYLRAIDWKLFISNEQFFTKLRQVEAVLARREGLRRGWLTYTELYNLLPSLALIKFLIKNFTILTISYTASIMTIIGAFFLASEIQNAILSTKEISNNTFYNLDNQKQFNLHRETSIGKTNDCLCDTAHSSDFEDQYQNCCFTEEMHLKRIEVNVKLNNENDDFEYLLLNKKLLQSNFSIVQPINHYNSINYSENCTHFNPNFKQFINQYFDTIFWLKLI